MWLPTTRKQTVRVNPARGVKVNYIYYWTAEFRDPAYAGKEVPVRYDPFDMSVAFVFLKDHWAECRSEYAAEFEGYSEREIAVATQEIRARQKRTGERRAVTARMIAEYLGGVTLTEQSLSKQKRRQQLSMGKDSELAGDVEEEPTNRSDRDDEEDPWGDITPEILGDLV